MMVRFSSIVWLITMICSLFHMKVKLPTIFEYNENVKLEVKMDMVGILSRKEIKNMKIARGPEH